MRVLHVIPSISTDLGGPSQVANNLVYSLNHLGIEAEILTTNFGMSDVPLNERTDFVFDTTQNLSVPVWFLPYDPPNLKEFVFSRAATVWMWQNLQSYDLLDNHYLFSYLPSCAAAIARWHNIPYTIRTMGQLTPWALSQSQAKKRLYSILIENRNLTKAAAIHCTAPGEAEDVRAFGIDTPTLTLPLGVNQPDQIPEAKTELRQIYEIPTELPIILFLSRLHYKKRPDLLLKSLADLTQLNQPYRAIFAGTGEPDYIAELKALALDLNIADDVIFPGMVTGQDKERLLQGSDIFALPSYSENFGIAVAEALIVGLPVVITKGIQIAPEIGAAQAGLIIEDTQKSLTEALLSLLKSPDQRQSLGEQGKQFAQTRYSWSAIAKQLAEAYEVICQHQKLPTSR